MAETDRNQSRTEGERTIDERLRNNRDATQADVVDAANQAFTQDQRSSDAPSRRERELSDEQDPSHSRGSTRQGPGGQQGVG